MDSLQDFLRNPGCFLTIVTILLFAMACYHNGEKQAGDMLLGGAMTYLVKPGQNSASKKD